MEEYEPLPEPPPDMVERPSPYARKKGDPSAEELLGSINRALPFSAEAEAAVLSSLMNDPSRMPLAQGVLFPASFHNECYRIVWENLLKRYLASEPLDPVLITDDLRKSGKLDLAGGPAMVTELFTFVPSAANFEHYLRVVQETYMRREVIRVCAQGVDSAQRWGQGTEGEDAARVVELVGQVESHIFFLVEKARSMGEAKEGAIPAVQGVAEWSDYLARIEGSRGKVLGVSTGVLELDSNLHGIDDAEGEIAIIAGRPGMGKTALAGSICNHLSICQKVPGLVISAEMSSNQFYSRLILGGAGVDTSKIHTGHFSEEDKAALKTQYVKLAQTPLLVCASSAITTADLRAQVQHLKRTQNIRWLMVDHLHLIKSSNPKHNGEERMRLVETMETLQFLKKEYKLAIFLMVQMDRGKDREHGKPPVLADLAGSAAIEWYADHVIFIHRPPYYVPWAKLSDETKNAWKELVLPRRTRNTYNWSDGNRYLEEDGWARQDYEEDAILFIRKNRRGPTPEVHVRYEPEFTRFSSRMPCLNSGDARDHQIGTWTGGSSRKAGPQAKPAKKGAGQAMRELDEVFPDNEPDLIP
jgi:replicative DNA helicase